jgi:hypothetical protein
MPIIISFFICEYQVYQKFVVSFYASTLLICTLASGREIEFKPGPFFFVAPLYWKADGNGLGFAIRSERADRLAPRSSVQNLDFDWDFGFQIALGYRIPHDEWRLMLELKHIHTNAHGLEKVEEGEALFPVWTLPDAAVSSVDKARAHWRLHLGLLDLSCTKVWKVSSCFTLEPSIGIRSAWIRQKYNLDYEGGALVNPESVRMKNKFWGIGPTGGIEGNWKILRHFTLFGEALFSFLSGEFYLHQDQDVFADKMKSLGIHSIFKDSVWTTDFTAGLRWSHCYQGALKRVACEIAWDQIFLYKQNQLMRFVNETAQGVFVSNQGDLALIGVHIGARFDF